MADRHQAQQLLPHWDAMVRACRRILDSEADAQECAASTVLQLLEERPAQVGGNEIQLVALAERRARDELRRAPRDRSARPGSAAVQDQDSEVADVAEARRRARARNQLAPATFELLQLLSRGREIRTAADELGIPLRSGPRPLHAGTSVPAVDPADAERDPHDASGLRGLLRRSTASALPAAVLGLVVLVGVVAAQGVTSQSRPPSVQQLSPADGDTGARPAPAARVRQQSPARAATQGVRTFEARQEPARRSGPRLVPPPAAAPRPSASAEDVTTEPDSGGGAVEELEECVEQILVTPGDLGC